MPKESDFSKKLRDDIKDYYAGSETFTPYVGLIRDTFNSGKKPFDIWVTFYKRFYPIELKMCRALSVNFDMVMPHQESALLKIKKSGINFEALVVIWLYKYNSKIALIIPIKKWLKIKKRTKAKSIKCEQLIDLLGTKHVMKREKIQDRTLWNVSKILGVDLYEHERH